MEYTKTNIISRDEACMPEPTENLTDVAKQTRIIASDVLAMTCRIRSHLFGSDEAGCGKEAEPRCFRDELTAARYELMVTAEELTKISQMLGVV